MEPAAPAQAELAEETFAPAEQAQAKEKPASGEKAEQIERFLTGLMEHLDNDAKPVITQGEGGAHTVEDWVPGMMFRMVDTLTEGETEWNTTAWGPIELPTAAVVEVQHD